MARITVEDCLTRVDNRFALVHLAAKRTRQLRRGSTSMSNRNNTEVVLALREIAAGLITVTNVTEHEPKPEEIMALMAPADDDLADDI